MANNVYETGAERSNTDKILPDFISPFMLEDVAKVLTQVMGPNGKYPKDNWRKGLPSRQLLNSNERHLLAIKKGEDIDPESGLPHYAHLICNAMFLGDNYYNQPAMDDRLFRLDTRRIGLDIDNVLADFQTPFEKLTGVPNVGWYASYKAREIFEGLRANKQFWMDLEPCISGDQLRFEPVVYITSRTIPIEWTQAWIEKNGFVAAPIVMVKGPEGKAEAVKDYNLDFFVDDNYDNFTAINMLTDAHCYLMDCRHNQRRRAGLYRLKSLAEL